MLASSLLLAAAAAGCNAVSSVLQRKVNSAEPRSKPFGPALVVDVIRQPWWLLGFAAMIASFLLQGTALGFGTLAAVEPVLAVELPLTLVLAAVLLHHRMHRRDWVGSATMAVGLAVFVAALAPSGGHPEKVSTAVTLLALAVTVAGIAMLALGGQYGPKRARAALFGAAAGSGFGLTASLLKLVVTRLGSGGVVGALTTWQTYAMAACGVGSVLLVQAALHAGTLVAAQPGLTLLDPFVASVWGILVLGENTNSGAILVLVAASAVAVIVAVLGLAEAAARDR